MSEELVPCGCDCIIRDGVVAYSPDIPEGAELAIEYCPLHEAAPDLLEALQALFVDYAESEGCYCGQIMGGTSHGQPLGKCGYCIAEKAIITAGGTFIPNAEGHS